MARLSVPAATSQSSITQGAWRAQRRARWPAAARWWVPLIGFPSSGEGTDVGTRTGTRAKMLTSAIALLRERGAAAGDPRTALHRFGELWASALRDSDFQAGCPIVSAAVGGSPDDEPLRSATAAIFDRWHDALRSTLVDAGVDADRARPAGHHDRRRRRTRRAAGHRGARRS